MGNLLIDLRATNRVRGCIAIGSGYPQFTHIVQFPASVNLGVTVHGQESSQARKEIW
jgi:hypothetical protein